MDLIPLLGLQLKDPRIIEILEMASADVVYDFDRLFEGLPDKYWASINESGLQLRFNSEQKLDTIFITITRKVTDAYFNSEIPWFESPEEAQRYNLPPIAGRTTGGGDLFGTPTRWVRLEFPSYHIHYEFRPLTLAMVTLSSVLPDRP